MSKDKLTKEELAYFIQLSTWRPMDPNCVAKRSGDARSFTRPDVERIPNDNILTGSMAALEAICVGKKSEEERGNSLVHLPNKK